jgi:hypothetical protein
MNSCEFKEVIVFKDFEVGNLKKLLFLRILKLGMACWG